MGHEKTGRLTPRQIRGYYNRIMKVEPMFTGEGGGGGSEEQDWDLNEIFDEAEVLNIPPPGDR
jgi:hypothetical protein